MNTISAIFVIIGIVTALIIAVDTKRNPQKMEIMESVWILSGLWGGLIALIAYFKFGQDKTDTNISMKGMKMDMPMKGMDMKMNMDNINTKKRPSWQSITLSTLHCGAGCTLADLIGEWFIYISLFTIAGSALLGSMVVDYILALIIGIYFQYNAIRAMSTTISRRDAVKKAIKADILSLTAWQIGMYGFMAIAIFLIFPTETLHKNSWTFWFMMQLAMMSGFVIAFPVNILLIRLGVKHTM